MWEILVAIICLLLALYVWMNWNYDYWKKRGVPYIEPTFLFGNSKDLVLLRKHVGEAYGDYYWKYPDEPAVGIYRLISPQLVLRDVELIKTVLVREFSSFHDNDLQLNPKANPLISKNPLLAKGETWKELRTFHTKHQSSGKIKGMFTLMLDVCKDMEEFLKGKQGVPLEAKYFCGQYTTDVLASSIYGLKTNSFIDPNAEFRKISSKLFEQNWYQNIALTLFGLSPNLTKLFNISFIPKEMNDFFVKVVEDMCEYRKTNKVSRSDFLQTMLDENLKSDTPKYTATDMAAHTLTFFVDGYETSSTLMAYVVYLLGLYPEYQDKIKNEIDKIGEITYDDLHSYKYLDSVVNETLRLYPPGLVLIRACTKDITLTAGDRTFTITKGTSITIPVYALHRDPKYFSEPSVFNPERFYGQQPPPAFLPFGMGPRACLGSRFALTQVKIGLAFLIKHFKISLRDSDGKLPTIDCRSAFLLPPRSGLWVKFESRK